MREREREGEADAEAEAERDRERERKRRAWWAHTGGGNALAFKPSPMRLGDSILSFTVLLAGWA